MQAILVLLAIVTSTTFAQTPLTPAQDKAAEVFADVLRPRGARVGYLVTEDPALPVTEFIDQVAIKLYGKRNRAYIVDMEALQSELDLYLLFGMPSAFIGSDRKTALEDFLQQKSEYNGALIAFIGIRDNAVLRALQARVYRMIYNGEHARGNFKIDLSKFTFVFAATQEFVISEANGVKSYFGSLKSISFYHKEDSAQKMTYAAVDKAKLKNFIPCKTALENP